LSGGLGTMGVAGAVFFPSDVQRNLKVAGLNKSKLVVKKNTKLFNYLFALLYYLS
jgi:hypothetical protein